MTKRPPLAGQNILVTGGVGFIGRSTLSNVMMDYASGNPWILRKPTNIGSGSDIGGPSSIDPGITIRDCIIVLPMSVVTEDIQDNVMVGGSPARVIRQIDEEWISRLKNELKSSADTMNSREVPLGCG